MGDLGIEATLDAIAFALNGQSNSIVRHQIQHSSLLEPDLLQRYVEEDTLASLRGHFNTCDQDTYGGMHSAVNRYALPGLGVHAYLETDAGWRIDPEDTTRSNTLNSMVQLYGLVTRQQLQSDGTGCIPDPWLTQHTITVEQALRVMTFEPAYAVSQEEYLGSLEPGKFADMIILDNNPLTLQPDNLKNNEVLMTMVGGQIEYCKTGQEVFCPSEESEVQTAATTIFYNGTILTIDENFTQAEALAVLGDKILAVGSEAEILAYQGADTTMIDLNGLTMTPGFIDSHSHRATQQDKWGFSTFEESTREWVTQGWTGIVELAVGEEHLNQMIAADAAGELHTRVNAYLTVNGFAGESQGDWYQKYEPGQQFSPYLRIAGLKIFIDYDSGRTQLWTQNDLNQFIQQRQSEGWQVTVKAVGIQSHELALNAYEHAMGGDLYSDFRYRIEHSVGSSDAQVARMADLGIIASIQPCWPGTIWHWEDILNLSEEQGRENMFQWRNYLDDGVMMAASPLNPPQLHTPVGDEEYLNDSHMSVMGLMYRSGTQIGLGGRQPESWMLTRALTANELLPMLTINGAYATFEDDVKGSLSPGKLADLVIFSQNPLVVAPNDLKDVQVWMTMIGGQTEYCASGQEVFCP
jgi:predicted amidohydrolase YtcJ